MEPDIGTQEPGLRKQTIWNHMVWLPAAFILMAVWFFGMQSSLTAWLGRALALFAVWNLVDYARQRNRVMAHPAVLSSWISANICAALAMTISGDESADMLSFMVLFFTIMVLQSTMVSALNSSDAQKP